jgi:hypothetical protein
MRLGDAAVIARLAHLVRDETAAFQAARRRPAICIPQSRLLYRGGVRCRYARTRLARDFFRSSLRRQNSSWSISGELPICAVIDMLINRFAAQSGRIALLGMSLGGYFVTRAAGYDSRLATVIASTPFPNPNQLFALSARSAVAEVHQPISTAMQRTRQHSLWKAGATDASEFLARTSGMAADPQRVTVPFLSVLGGGDSPVFAEQAMLARGNPLRPQVLCTPGRGDRCRRPLPGE